MSVSPVFIGLAVLDGLLLWLLIGARGHWAAKAATTVLVLSFNFVVWSSLDAGRGWPTPDTPPERAAFVSCIVQEPDALTHTSGAIYLWLIPIDSHVGVLDYHPATSEPRAYRQPYSRDLHKACVTATRAASQGVAVGLRRGHGHGRRGHQPGGKFVPYLLPSPSPSRKGR